jgi:hypothetical protein
LTLAVLISILLQHKSSLNLILATIDEFFRKTLNLVNELNKGDVTDEQQLLVIKTWMFIVWLAHCPNKTVDEFLSNLLQYCGEARLAKGIAETFHWTVLPNANTSCYQGHKRSLDNDNHNQDFSRIDKKKSKKDRQDRNNFSSSSSSSSSRPQQSVDNDSRCNVCNQL